VQNPWKGAFVGNFGATEIIIILVIIVLLFGSSRLPRIARGTGKHLRKTKDSVGTFKDEFESGMREIDPVTPLKETMRDADPSKATAPKDKAD
jgi:sec-independent protein translocase protein TatA